MKKVIIIFGTFLLFLISIATLFRLMHWPGSAPIFVITMTLFSAIYLPLFFIDRIITNRTALNTVANVLGLIATSLLFMGVMFKLMHWPGASLMIVVGAVIFIFPVLILYMIQQFKEYDRKFSEFWRTVLLVVFVCIFLIFWGTRPTRNVLYGFLKVEDATLETNKNLGDYNMYILNQVKEKDSMGVYSKAAQNIHEQSLATVEYIENIKKIVVQRAELDPEAVKDHWFISSLDESNIPTYYLGSGSEMGGELLGNLSAYKSELKNQMQKLPIDKALIEELGDFGIKTEAERHMMEEPDLHWNGQLFDHQVIAGALALLTGTQNEVLNTEFKCLKIISLKK